MTTSQANTSMEIYLKETSLLDYQDSDIQQLIYDHHWNELPEYEKIGAIYHFVQNDIPFGYNESDQCAASDILKDGYGQCNTKGTLLMALLRAVSVPCRTHGFSIDKKLQKGAITGLFYALSPKQLIHSWVEVYYQQHWVNLEGFILDKQYLSGLHCQFPDATGAFCGYGVSTPNFKEPPIDWKGTDTYIQKESISHDYGVFDDPDSFYQAHGANLSGSSIKGFLYKTVVRKIMNATIANIRSSKDSTRVAKNAPPEYQHLKHSQF